jgi:Carboxypeptidase regulatory-like domain/TonB-dependent Receptor Plug Domain/TonB dependent receptor
MPLRMRPCTCLLAILLMLPAAPAHAQFDTGSIVGAVRDATGAVVPGATVTLTSAATGLSVTKTTDAEGNYEFFTVRPGIYLVTAEKTGFALALVENVQVQVAARMRVDLQMAVGQVTEKVEVVAASPLLETETSQRGQVISGEQTRALPLNGREYSSLALLTTGVRQSALGRASGTPREGAFNVNGLRSTFNNFLIDGIDNNAYGTSNQGFSNQVMQPPPDAVDEFKVVTNNESAEYGRSAGATINVAYRSGTNAFHGSAWEFNRSTALNATGYFTPPSGEKPPLERNQFGGVLGGPIIRNKAFFFGDYEGFRQNRKQVSTTTIATPQQRRGILPVDVRDPRTGITYPAGTPIPMTGFASNVLGGLPDPTRSDTSNNYVILQQFTNNTDKAGGKVDVRVSPALSAFGRYGWRELATDDQPPIPLPSGGSGNGHIYARNKQLVLGTTYVPGASSLFEFRFGYSTTQGGKNPPSLGSASAFDAFGVAGLPTDTRIAGGLPTQLITGYSDLGRQATNPQWQYPTVWNPKANYTWTRGRHSMKAGYEFQRVNVEVQDVNPLYGRDTYSGQFTRPAGVAANNIYNLADFMLGLRSQYALSNVLVAEMQRNMHFTYLQDDFRVADRLTLNLGLRYEYGTPMWEADNMLSNYDPAARRMLLAKDGSLADRALVNPDRNNLAPRLGFAFTPAPGTAVRGGYGISYVHVNRVGAADVLAINGPQVINAVVNQTSPADPSFRPTERGYPSGLASPSTFNPLTANVTYIPADFQAGRVQSYFLSVQRELGRNMLVDVAYVGNRGDELLLLANYNQATPNSATVNIPLQARRPIPEFSDITYVFNGGKSRYNALQMKYEWRMAGGMSVLSSLTLSRTKDNGAQSLENNNGNFPAPQNYYDLDAEYGISGYHQPYNSTTSFIWSLPFGRGHRWGHDVSRPLDMLIGGWQIAGINTVTPGEPVTFIYTPAADFVVSGIAQDFRGANNYRPNVTCDPYAAAGQQSITNWFNRDCVAIPTDRSQPFGNAGRNTVRGPGFWQLDAAASKSIALGSSPTGARLEVRVEAFNLLDRANFTAPNSNRSAAGFGTITSTYDPRQVQLGVKVLW